MGYLDKNGVTYLWSKIKSIFATKEYVDNAIENAPSGGGGIGESTTGKVYVIDRQEVTADVGAEIFNDYTNNIATGQYAHAEGYKTTAKGNYSHVEGNNTKATANASHAEGQNTTASGVRAHAEGYGTTARSNDSHAEGFNTTSASSYQHVQGRYNIVDSSGTYAHIVGNGASGALSNAHTIDWSGNGWFQGNVYIGGTKQSEGKQLATQEYVEEALGNIPSGVTSWNDLTDKPTIPTKTSQLTNDSGFITLNDIPESGGGSGGVTSWNDLTDKPFGEEFSEILPPTEVIMDGTSGGVVLDAIEGIEDNKTYIVGYNNVNYECIAKAITEDGITSYVLGNLSMLGMEDNGYPFLLMIVSPSQVADVGVGALVYAFDSPSSITLSIAGEKIIPIDIKYLPESLQFGEITTGEGDTFTWDGDTTGKEITGNGYFVKVSDVTPTLEELQKGTFVGVQGQMMEVTNELHAFNDEKRILAGTFLCVVFEDGTYSGHPYTKGLYLGINDYVVITTIKINDYKGFSSTVVKPLETKYLPKHLQFGSEIIYGEIMSERELMPGDYFMPVDDSGELPFIFPQLVEGSTYTVVYNGVSYDTQCVSVVDGGIIALALGNVGMMGDGLPITNEPFIAMVVDFAEFGGNVMMVMPLDGAETITMSLSGESEVLTKLDTKYLPTQFIVNITSEDGGDTYIVDKTFNEISRAFVKGLQIVAKYDNSDLMPLVTLKDYEATFLNISDGSLGRFTIDFNEEVFVSWYTLQ